MNRYDKSQLIAFIRSLDRHLSDKVKIIVIGGAAASIAYDSNSMTADIDIFNILEGDQNSLLDAAEKARHETGLSISLGSGSVADLPYNYEDRLKHIRGVRLDNLKIEFPDKYDLVLSKTLRGYPHDIDAIEGVNRHHHLSLTTLVNRFESELVNMAISDTRIISLNMVLVIERLYGRKKAVIFAEKWNLSNIL